MQSPVLDRSIASDSVADDAPPAEDQNSAAHSPPKDKTIDKVWNYFRKRFDDANWFGSTILLSYIYRDYNGVRAARSRLVNGERQPDNIRTFNYASSIGISGVSFISKREGKMPEGNSYRQRVQNTLKHPGQSLPQFEYLVSLPSISLGIYNNVRKGLKAHGISLAPGEARYTAEKVRLYESILMTVATLFSGHGLFKKKYEALPKTESAIEETSEVKGTIRKIWRHDRSLLVGSGLGTAIPVLSAVEAWNKSNKSRKEAFFLLRSTAVGVTAVAAYYFYVFQRIVKSNFEKKTSADTDNESQKQSNSSSKEKPKADPVDKTWNYLKSRFTRDNFFGSLVIPLSMKGGFQALKTAQNHTINGVPSPDTPRILATRIFLAERAWSFFSARGARFPEGINLQQRMGNAIRHPQRSSAQFEYLLLLPSRLLTAFAHTKAGLAAYGIGAPQTYDKEHQRFYQGALQIVWLSFLGYGHFKKRQNPEHKLKNEALTEGSDENSKDEAPSSIQQPNMSMLDVVRKIWKQDRVLALGYMLDAVFPIMNALEGWGNSSRQREDAIQYAKSAASGAAVSAAYSLYTFQRIARSNFSTPVQPPSQPVIPVSHEKPNESKAEVQPVEPQSETAFTQKIDSQKHGSSILQNRPSASFTERLRLMPHSEAPDLAPPYSA